MYLPKLENNQSKVINNVISNNMISLSKQKLIHSTDQ